MLSEKSSSSLSTLMKSRFQGSFFFIILLSLWGLISCSHKEIPMETSAQIPAAKGTVTAKKTENENTKIDLKVNFLAPPQKIDQTAQTYVVWIRPHDVVQEEPVDMGMGSGEEGSSEEEIIVDMRESQPEVYNAGTLKIDEKNLKGEMEAITPYQNFDLFITAEKSARVSQPMGEKLLWIDSVSAGRDIR